MTALHLIVGTLQRTHVFGVENRDTLTHKATGVNTSRIASLYETISDCLCCNPDLKLLFCAVFCKAVKEA